MAPGALTAVGLRPINNVVDVGNYVMLETGQPLHAFDARKLGGAQIIVRRAVAGEKLTTLDGKERVLTPEMLVIADATKPLVIAGIMGGVDSGVSPDTTDLVLECAFFKRQSIRATGKRLGLSSDSSYRYERGVDVHSSHEAAYRAIDLIIATAGGNVVGPAFRVGSDIPWQREIVVTHDYITEKLGFDIPAAEMRAAFEALEFTITREEPTAHPARGPAWTVGIPSWRDDLDRPIDLVEEVLRLYGTEKFRPPSCRRPVSSPTMIPLWSSIGESRTTSSATIFTSASITRCVRPRRLPPGFPHPRRKNSPSRIPSSRTNPTCVRRS